MRGDDGKAWRRAAGRGRNWNGVLTSRHVPGGQRFRMGGARILLWVRVRSPRGHREEARFSGAQRTGGGGSHRADVSVCGGASIACDSSCAQESFFHPKIGRSLGLRPNVWAFLWPPALASQSHFAVCWVWPTTRGTKTPLAPTPRRAHSPTPRSPKAV